jgi:hypothetical protein
VPASRKLVLLADDAGRHDLGRSFARGDGLREMNYEIAVSVNSFREAAPIAYEF